MNPDGAVIDERPGVGLGKWQQLTARARLELVLTLMSGLLYVVIRLMTPRLLAQVYGLPSVVPLRVAGEHGTALQGVDLSLLIPPLVLILVAVARSDSTVTEALRFRIGKTIKVASIVVLLSILLNAVGLWQFTWRWTSTPDVAYALLAHSKWLAIAMWGVTGVILVPLIEETIFRFGVLRVVWSLTGSRVASVVMSAVLFTAGHWGTIGEHPNGFRMANMIWLFFGSVLVGGLTLRDKGNLSLALTAHATRNAIEFATLLFATAFLPGPT